MTQETVIDMMRNAVFIILEVSAPMLLASLIIGLVVSLIQTLTSIQEATLSFVPKLLVIMLMLILTGSWMLTTIGDYTKDLFSNFGNYIHENTEAGFMSILPYLMKLY